MRLYAIIAAVLVSLVVLPQPAAAACNQGGEDLSDLAGVYISPYHQMRVEVWECNGFEILWDNLGGRHQAAYLYEKRLEGGGVIGRDMGVSPVTLDDARRAIVKPAEPGYIEVLTASPYGDIRVYRLAKWR